MRGLDEAELSIQDLETTLAHEMPEFRRSYWDHYAEDDGSLISTIMLARLCDFLADVYKAGDVVERDKIAQRIADLIEGLASSSNLDLQDIVATGFLENLFDLGTFREDFRTRIGPHTNELVRQMKFDWVGPIDPFDDNW